MLRVIRQTSGNISQVENKRNWSHAIHRISASTSDFQNLNNGPFDFTPHYLHFSSLLFFLIMDQRCATVSCIVVVFPLWHLSDSYNSNTTWIWCWVMPQMFFFLNCILWATYSLYFACVNSLSCGLCLKEIVSQLLCNEKEEMWKLRGMIKTTWYYHAVFLSHGDELKCWGCDDGASSLSLFPGPVGQSTFSVCQPYS